MSKYAQAAVSIVQRCQNVKSPDLKYEWGKAMLEFYPNQEPSRKKGCPKNAFLGLCESGMVVGILPGNYGVRPNSLNKKYAIEAALIVLGGDTDKKTIWERVSKSKKAHNSQVDIVLAINSAGLLQPSETQS